MKSITGNIEIDYMEGRSDTGVVYENGEFSHYLIKGKATTLYDILAQIRKRIYSNELDAAEKLLEMWKPMIYSSKDESLIAFYHSVDFERSHWFFNSLFGEDELSYQKKFDQVVEEKFPEYKLIKKKNDPKHIPDAWVEEDGEEIPVEMKLNDFNKKALKQLQRYMTVYEKHKGVAIGRNLTVELPPNIRFISLDEIE